MSLGIYYKDPDSILDFKIDWSDYLESTDSILTSTWIADSGINVGNNSTHDNTTSTVWLSGGTVGIKYSITNRIVTAQNRTDDRSFTVIVKSL